MIRIGSNILSLQAQRRLAESSDSLSKVYERLASGMRINRASDDAAGLSIASQLNSDTRIYTQALKNAQDGLSLLNIADGALSGLTNVIHRLQELAEQSANGIYSSKQRSALNTEGQALRNEYNRIISDVKFNGINLFDPATGDMQLQIGGDGSANSVLSFDLGRELQRDIGDGTFGEEYYLATFSSGANAIGDIDNDGDDDIIANAFAGAGPFVVFLSNGDGTFKAPVTYQGPSIRGLYLNDLDGDGNLDALAVRDSFGGQIHVVLGNGDGTFRAPTLVGSLGSNYEATVGDVNGDGILDIVSHGTSPTSSFGVILGLGNGTFAPMVTYAGGTTYGVVIGDFNGDGRADLFTGIGTGGSLLLLGNGDGTFKSGVTIAGTDSGQLTQAADLNGDGHLDIIAVLNGIRISLGNGDGTFKASSAYETFAGNGFMDMADLNDDGILDVVVSDTTTFTVRALLGNGDGTFKAPISRQQFPIHVKLSIGDVNGDDVPDVVGSNNSAFPGVYISIQNTTKSVTLKSFSLETRQDALDALTQFSTALNRIIKERSNIGAVQSRLEVASANLYSIRENYITAYSRIVDADVAEETSNLIRLQILQNSASAVLAQANQSPSLALKLLNNN